MARTLLTIGPVHTILQNVVYALPARAVFLQSADDIQTSLDGTTWTTITASSDGVETSAAFVRCATGDTEIILKA